MVQRILEFIIRNFLSLFILLLIVRFTIQIARVSFPPKFVHFVTKTTDFIVLPIRHLFPPVFGVDITCLIAAWFIGLLMHWALLAITPWPFNWLAASSIWALILLSLLEILRLFLYLLETSVLVLVIISWLAPYSPLKPLFVKLIRPFLRPLQRFLPSFAGVDLSPLILIIMIQLIQNVLMGQITLKLFQLLVINHL